MPREIKIQDIGKVMEESIVELVAATTLEWTARVKKATPVFSKGNYTPEELKSMPNFFTLPNGRVAPLKVAINERGTGGELRGAWQTDIQRFKGTIINNKPYAEPVCFGEGLPPSWKGQFRTRQNVTKGFPELIAKELQQWSQNEYNKIKSRI